MLPDPNLAVPAPLSALRPHPDNPRTISRERFAALVASLRADPGHLWQRPLGARRDGTVYLGNMRLLAARELGWSAIPVVYEDLPEAEERLRLLRDNREYGEDDERAVAEMLHGLQSSGADVLLSGFDPKQLTALLDSVGGAMPAGDDADLDPPAEPTTKPGDLWTLGEHRLLCGDATSPGDVGRLMGGDRASLVFTSPPYAVGNDYASYDDTLQNLRTLLIALAGVWPAVLTESAYCVTNFGDVVSAQGMLGTSEPCEYPMAVEYWPIFRERGWILHTRRVWAKPHARVAAPWTASSNRAASDWEHLWTWKRPGRGLNERRDPSYLGVWDTSRGEGVEVGKETHPAAFPVQLPRWVLVVYSDRGDAVADPFAGTGTTLAAAEALARRAYLMEIDPGYCDVICERWRRLTGREPVLERREAVPA